MQPLDIYKEEYINVYYLSYFLNVIVVLKHNYLTLINKINVLFLILFILTPYENYLNIVTM